MLHLLPGPSVWGGKNERKADGRSRMFACSTSAFAPCQPNILIARLALLTNFTFLTSSRVVNSINVVCDAHALRCTTCNAREEQEANALTVSAKRHIGQHMASKMNFRLLLSVQQLQSPTSRSNQACVQRVTSESIQSNPDFRFIHQS